MKGTLYIYRTTRMQPEIKEYSSQLPENEINSLIGCENFEVISRFSRYRPSRSQNYLPCFAFCDEDGKRKNLLFNSMATALWEIATRNNFPVESLLGTVVIVTGDKEFMDAL